ncbi:MAG: hypothetical protein MH204_06650 [Fimbriimonadaceae bacterium]|jgi:hypothetical protein|nr:hypothetical protein [Fimbriimonadaceae bacterium]
MVLHVSWKDLPEALDRLGLPRRVWMELSQGRILLTAADPGANCLVRSEVRSAEESVHRALTDLGLEVLSGRWADREEDAARLWVASVAYQSDEARPGLWVDALPYEPTEGEVLLRFHEEMKESGLGLELSLEEFRDAIQPNVVILSPDDLSRFALASDPACS